MIASSTLLRAIDWDSDYRDRINPDLINELLYQAVPALKASDWKITDVQPGFCESVLPLNVATTNQHGTHQAALISLSADYTGGMALTTLLRGVPLAGIHRCQAIESASLWLAEMNVRYLNPSTGHLIGRCRVPEKQSQLIVNRYAQGKRVLVSLPIEFESNGQKVAEAELVYFAQPTIQLLEPGRNPSALFSQKIKASARMIAGVRANAYFESNGRLERYDCPFSALAAGPQGELLARKLREALPQLPEMVLARTRHADSVLRSIPGLKQVLIIGVGLDMRPFRMQSEMPDVHFFEVDLPPMLAERDRVAQQIHNGDSAKRTTIAADFINDDLAAVFGNCKHLDPTLPTAVIYEGCTMYFEAAINEKMFQAVRPLLRHPESRLWADFVTEDVVDGRTLFPEVARFLKSMEELGESFVYGANVPSEVTARFGFRDVATVTVRKYLESIGYPTDDPVKDFYQFHVAGGDSA
jgi:methyltransferase (TIGR00027 family)